MKKSLKERARLWLRETVETLVVAFVLAFLIRTFFVQAFYIPSPSMEPTLRVGDRIFVYKFLYGLEKVKRGDIVVFEYPKNPKKDYVKRAIGLPGETVKIVEKKVYIDGEPLEEPYAYHEDNFYLGYPRDNYGPIVVPKGSLFVLGDNRDASQDSRFWGFVPRKNIKGKAVILWWPPFRIRIIKRPHYGREVLLGMVKADEKK